MFSTLFLKVVFETFVILSAILLPVKSPIASAVLWIAFFEAVFIASVATLVAPDFLALSITFWLFLLLTFLPIFLANDKNS